MIGGVIPSGIEHTNPTIAMLVKISTHAIKPPIKQHNIVIQKPFLELLRFSLPQSVFAILTIARIIKTKLAIENMESSTKIAILMEKIAELLEELSTTIKSMINSRMITPTNENEAIPKFLINLAFFKIDSWLLHVDDLSVLHTSGKLSDIKTPMIHLKTITLYIYIYMRLCM